MSETQNEEYCQDCGRLIVEDMVGYDDACSAPYVTSSGDLFCIPCGREIEDCEEEQLEDADDFALWDYNTWEDIIEDEKGGVYIGPDNDTLHDGDSPTE